jgi:hypothetical protein
VFAKSARPLDKFRRLTGRSERSFTKIKSEDRSERRQSPMVAIYVRHHDRTQSEITTMSTLKAPLGLALAVLLSSTAFAQQDGAGSRPQSPPQMEKQAPASAAPSTQTQTPSPQTAPTVQRSGPDTTRSTTTQSPDSTVTQQRGGSSTTTVTQERRGPSRSYTNDRSDRRWDSDRRSGGSRVVIRDRVRPAFAFISGPRIIVRPGWCRGLHRGWHSAPGLGPHAGTHRGLFRC